MTANKHAPMVVAAARALCRRDSDLCNVDFDDNWKLYGDGFLADAQVALESIAAPELLEFIQHAAYQLESGIQEYTGSPEEPPQPASKWDYDAGQLVGELRRLIAQATGGAA